MAGIKFTELAQRFIAALEMAGLTVLVVGGLDRRPLRVVAIKDRIKYSLEVHLWTITPGGKGRNRPRERRIQKTNAPEFVIKSDSVIVVGGWSEETGVFAFWDVRRHTKGSQKSPSMQISLDTLERAHHVGMATEAKRSSEGLEVCIAVHPDYILWYLEELERLFNCGIEIDDTAKLVDGKPEDDRDFVDSGTSESAKTRREKVVEVVRHFREARFRPLVLRAYSYRCCLTGIALRLVDAAHIVPVCDPTHTDEANNGVALNPLLHRAYDTGVLGLFPKGRTAWNPRLLADLKLNKLDAGLDTVRGMVPAGMTMPKSRDFVPPDDYFIRGLKGRGWTASEISSVI
ncbi:MAG: HNH endonuclease [bacterium]|jgi:putative restriction endonuclease|nr:HNH endonuclease [Phycisphaerales bacterium]